jgi:MFS family permease
MAQSWCRSPVTILMVWPSACTQADRVRLLLTTILTCLCVVDPLNYPLWRRDLITSILCLSSVIASTLSPLLAANTLALVLYYNTPESPGAPRPPPRSFTNVALLTGYHLLGVGVAGFIFVASARVWGKRHLYLLGAVIIIISSAWAGASGHNYNSLLAARFFQGVGLAPFGKIVQAAITVYL